MESSPLPRAGSHHTGGRRVGADSAARTSSGTFFPLSLGRLSSLERGKWREVAHGWRPCEKEVGKISALAIPGLHGQGPENPQGTKFPGSTQHHDRDYSLTLSKSGQSASASCRAMGTAIATLLSRSTLLSTERVSPTSSPSTSFSCSTRLSGRLCNLLACMEHKAALQSYGRLLQQNCSGGATPQCSLGAQEPEVCPKELGQLNAEAEVLGAAGTALRAQPHSRSCITQHSLPSPILPVQVQASSSHLPGTFAEHEEASEHQAMHFFAVTLQMTQHELQDGINHFFCFKALQELKDTGCIIQVTGCLAGRTQAPHRAEEGSQAAQPKGSRGCAEPLGFLPFTDLSPTLLCPPALSSPRCFDLEEP